MDNHRAGRAILAFTFLTVTCMAQPASTDHRRLNVPFYPQKTNGCGLASIKMVQMYWSAHKPGLARPNDSELLASLPLTEKGTLLSDMRNYLDSKEYYAFTMQANLNDLDIQVSKGRIPIVALKKKADAEMHYVVVTGVDSRKVWLNDPAQRRPSSMDRNKFEKQWAFAGGWLLLAVPRVPGGNQRAVKAACLTESISCGENGKISILTQ